LISRVIQPIEGREDSADRAGVLRVIPPIEQREYAATRAG
jgi:hypothetical protein